MINEECMRRNIILHQFKLELYNTVLCKSQLKKCLKVVVFVEIFLILLKMSVLRNLVPLLMRNTNIYCGLNQISAKNFVTNSQLFGSAYDSDGKTVVNILNNEEGAPLMVNGYSKDGFRLNNGLFAVGPVVMFPRSILSWNVKDDHSINEHSMSLFLHLSPRLDVLVIGLSDSRDQKLLWETRKNLHKLFISKGVTTNIEVLPTEKAVTTYNFLNAEERFVGAAMIPPVYYSPTADDEYQIQYLNKKKEQHDFLLES